MLSSVLSIQGIKVDFINMFVVEYQKDLAMHADN
jgi:hypothetical protein